MYTKYEIKTYQINQSNSILEQKKIIQKILQNTAIT